MINLSQKEKEKIIKLRAQFPKHLDVSIHSCEEGGFTAIINNFQGCITEGETFSELINMINDCIYTYFEIPLKYLSYMPTYLPSISVAAGFDFFKRQNNKKIKTDFKITSNLNEKVAV